jgi:hypothetical protein
MELIQLLPEQVMEYWDYIKDCVTQSLPPHVKIAEETFITLQENALTGALQCWLAIEESTHPLLAYGLMTTEVTIDKVSGSRNLLIFTVTVTDAHPKEMWSYCLEKMHLYAKNRHCDSIIAYSNNPRMIEIAKGIGADCSWNLIQFFL